MINIFPGGTFDLSNGNVDISFDKYLRLLIDC